MSGSWGSTCTGFASDIKCCQTNFLQKIKTKHGTGSDFWSSIDSSNVKNLKNLLKNFLLIGIQVISEHFHGEEPICIDN